MIDSAADRLHALHERFMGRSGNVHLLMVLEALPELETVVRTAQLKRNSIVFDGREFKGEWVAVPAEDFTALRSALQSLDNKLREQQ